MQTGNSYICVRCEADSGAPRGSHASVVALMERCAYCRRNYELIGKGKPVLRKPTAKYPTATGKGMGK